MIRDSQMRMKQNTIIQHLIWLYFKFDVSTPLLLNLFLSFSTKIISNWFGSIFQTQWMWRGLIRRSYLLEKLGQINLPVFANPKVKRHKESSDPRRRIRMDSPWIRTVSYSIALSSGVAAIISLDRPWDIYLLHCFFPFFSFWWDASDEINHKKHHLSGLNGPLQGLVDCYSAILRRNPIPLLVFLTLSVENDCSNESTPCYQICPFCTKVVKKNMSTRYSEGSCAQICWSSRNCGLVWLLLWQLL